MSQAIIIKCPKCGRNMPSYREECFTCSGIVVRESQEFVDEAKEFAPKKKQLVPDEVRFSHKDDYQLPDVPRGMPWRDWPENIWSVNSLSYIKDRDYGPSDLPDMEPEPEREPCRFHITMWPGYEGTPDPTFHRAQLMDTENGAGALKTTTSQICEDPEVMAKSMPGRNVGYTKNGIKPKCPEHGITVDEYGRCPICNQHIIRRHNSNGTVVTTYEGHNDSYKHPEDCVIYVKNEGQKTILNKLPWDTEWLQDEPIGKMNFVGLVNKKSDGRCNRTGDIGDPKSEKYMQQYRHMPALKIDYNVQVIDDEPQYTGLDVPVRKVKADLNECECGCKIHMTEMRRGDKLCPQCGLVLGRVQISQQATRGGDDDVEYGG